ncbi:hypothetical protein ACFS32_15215 [Novosphingobium pokkalii]|uniref:hypothetical protein n=1 Tax=Novosphingobium pokkalii TaxID=1770194 RepID=UPI003644C13F
MWEIIFKFLALSFVAFTSIGLINPKWIRDKKTGKIPKRSEIAAGGILLAIISMGLANYLTAKVEPNDPNVPQKANPKVVASQAKDDEIEPWLKTESIVTFPKGELLV